MKRIAASDTANSAVETPNDGATADDLSVAARLSLDDVRRLCQTLAVELGLTPAGIQVYGSYVDLVFSSTVLLRPRQVLIRATTEPASASALDNVRAEAADRGCADHLLVSSHPSQDELIAESEHVLGATEFIELCRRSAMVEWPNRRPRVRRAAYQTARQRAEALSELDVLGLAWLPALSRHRLPPTLRHSTISADEWFERAVFRVITGVFRVNGYRLGSASRGKRDASSVTGGAAVPDARALRQLTRQVGDVAAEAAETARHILRERGAQAWSDGVRIAFQAGGARGQPDGSVFDGG